MIKRSLTILTLLAVVFAAVGLGTAPVTAKPVAADVGSPNAKLLTADTALYVDIRTGDLDKTVNFVLDTVQKVTGFRPGNPYAELDKGLTDALGRKASFDKDIKSWLGDHLTIGLSITDEQIASLKDNAAGMGRMFDRPNAIAIISVKDDAAAKTFLTEVIEKSKSNVKFTNHTDSIGDTPVTIYEQTQESGCPSACGSVVLAKGYVAIGTTTAVNAMIAARKANKPSLADDANFTKVVGALKPNNLATVYIGSRFYQIQFAAMQTVMDLTAETGLGTPEAATPDANKRRDIMRAAIDVIQGQAFGARMDGKVLALDVAQSFNLQGLTKLSTEFGLPGDLLRGMSGKSIEGKLAGQIPNKALAVIIASGLPNLYEGIKGAVKAGNQLNQQLGRRGTMQGNFDLAQVEKGIRQFEAALKLAFDLDINKDILSWMGGEFALYMTYNPTGTLSKMQRNSWPFDHAVLIQTSDAAKTKSFLTKLNAGLEKNAKQVKIKSAGDNLFSLTTGDGLELAYGLVGDTFLVTTGSGVSGATAAIKGDGVLTTSEEWKRAQASMVKPTSQIWYVNIAQITPLVKALADLQGNQDANTKQGLAALELLESASISGGVLSQDGLSLSSLQLTLK